MNMVEVGFKTLIFKGKLGYTHYPQDYPQFTTLFTVYPTYTFIANILYISLWKSKPPGKIVCLT